MLKRNDNGEAALEFYEKRRLWAEYASNHPDLTDRGFRLGYWLSRRMNGEDQCCWYSVKRMAKELGWSERSVQRGIADLKAANLIFVVEQKGKRSEYQLHAPFF